MPNEKYRYRKEYNYKDTLETYHKLEELAMRLLLLWHFERSEYQSVSTRDPYDFIINKYAKKGGTAIELCSEAWIEEDTPTRKTWKDKHLFNVEIQKHLSNGTIPRLMHALDTTAMSINYALIIVSAVYSLNSMNVFTCAACLLALLITILLRSFIAAKVIKRFNARTKLWKTVFHELNMLVHIMTYRVLHILSDKNDFICHKM